MKEEKGKGEKKHKGKRGKEEKERKKRGREERTGRRRWRECSVGGAVRLTSSSGGASLAHNSCDQDLTLMLDLHLQMCNGTHYSLQGLASGGRPRNNKKHGACLPQV
ncbi:hypothetical protein MRB53_000697 [Persea americana]|uniref:Uncharacterized protein n=1 Tax=Persea americana TaxID=3435 RepID=A0ACC2MPS3_PERAE|nr:hypothetical protein MRB53_000697 [Persea americana]